MKVWIEERQDFFVYPVFKSQMVYWLKGYYPQDEAKFRRMSCRQLRAIICSTVRRQAMRQVQIKHDAGQVGQMTAAGKYFEVKGGADGM